jgi:hypothetical protein
VNGAATLVLQAGASAMLVRVASAWQAAVISNNSAIGAQLVAAASATAAHDLLTAPWVDVASAGTTDIGAANSLNVRVTGTTTITSLGTVANGIRRYLRFAAALTLTHNATSLILPGGANITTAAGDTAIAISLGSGNWVVVNYMPAGGYVRQAGTANLALGSAAAPSMSFSGDPDTGMFSPGANRLGFAANGVAAGEFNGTDFQFNSGYGSVATAYGCRAWVNFNGTGTVAIRASGNVSSITDNGTGDYTVNFTTNMPDANYAVAGINGHTSGGGAVRLADNVAPTVSSVRFNTMNNTGTTPIDVNFATIVIVR